MHFFIDYASRSFEFRAMDILTDVLQTTHLRNICHGPVFLDAPWGVRLDRLEGRYGYLIVADGECVLDVEGEGTYRLAKGDVVFLTKDQAHTLRSDAGVPATSSEDFQATRKFDENGFETYGGTGKRTVMIWGGFDFEPGRRNPLLMSLPPIIHVRGNDDDGSWLQSCVRYLADEVTAMSPGYEMIANRLIDILFVQALRTTFLEADAEGLRGWGCSLMDSEISRALGAIHGDPSRPWTVESLAAVAGMSRSSFAVRFADCVGSTPAAYLTSWRMQRAAETLRSTAATLTEIAERSGYSSEAALIRAFKRSYGATPQAYRRAQRSRRDAAAG